MKMDNDLKGPGMFSYSFDAESAISYGEMKFKAFDVREVFINKKQKGEFHIKPKDGKDPVSALLFLKSRLSDCSVGLADPSGLLSLEYPIYLICKSGSLVMDSIRQIFEQIDEEISGKTVS